MENQELIQQIAAHVELAQKQMVSYNEIYQNDSITGNHQFLFFIKPEITRDDSKIQLTSILNMMMEQLNTSALKIERIAVIGAAYLEKYDIISQHYGVINAICRDPHKYVSEEAQAKFESIYNQPFQKSKILGGLEFLNEFSNYNAESLNILWQNSMGSKIGGGAYCAPVRVNNETYYILNGFHPSQIQHFTAPGRSIVAFSLRGNLDWPAARNQFIGKTNPAEAASESLRNRLLVKREEFGLDQVSSSLNGFHLSAGPLEGLVELKRYGSDFSSGNIKTTESFIFGRMLMEKFNQSDIQRMCNNEMMVIEGKNTGAFDLTEEKNSDEALKLLSSARFKN
jgi:hypothetical protein